MTSAFFRAPLTRRIVFWMTATPSAVRAVKGPGEVSVVSGSIDRVPCWDFLSLSPSFFHLAGAAVPPRNATGRAHIETWDRRLALALYKECFASTCHGRVYDLSPSIACLNKHATPGRDTAESSRSGRAREKCKCLEIIPPRSRPSISCSRGSCFALGKWIRNIAGSEPAPIDVLSLFGSPFFGAFGIERIGRVFSRLRRASGRALHFPVTSFH